MDPDRARLLRSIPAVHALLEREDARALVERYGRPWVVRALGDAAAAARERVLRDGGADPSPVAAEALVAEAGRRLRRLFEPSLRRVINATGIVVHTNLGRAPLPRAAAEAVARVAGGYSSLEYDLERGERGSRQAHVERLLTALTGAEAALVVNNNAAAVLLALTALARGRSVVVSRGELVEIGGSFRVPDVMLQSGARLVEVGTTNRTHLADYERAIDADTALLLKVHRSNYRLVGFTAEAGVGELAALARRHGLPLLYDLGSGALLDPGPLESGGEPLVGAALRAGADLVSFSGDKLLGGPQAGILLGRGDLIEACRRHPLARAVRIDKLCLAALEAVLRLYLDPERARREVPVLAMLGAAPEELARRAAALAERLRAVLPGWTVAVEADHASQAGGGSLPGVDLPTAVVAITPPGGVAAYERRLRQGEPPVVARVRQGRVLLDLRTVLPEEEDVLARRLVEAAAARD